MSTTAVNGLGMIIGSSTFDHSPRSTKGDKSKESYFRNTKVRKNRYRLRDPGDTLNRLLGDERFPKSETITREQYYELHEQWEEKDRELVSSSQTSEGSD